MQFASLKLSTDSWTYRVIFPANQYREEDSVHERRATFENEKAAKDEFKLIKTAVDKAKASGGGLVFPFDNFRKVVPELDGLVNTR